MGFYRGQEFGHKPQSGGHHKPDEIPSGSEKAPLSTGGTRDEVFWLFSPWISLALLSPWIRGLPEVQQPKHRKFRMTDSRISSEGAELAEPRVI